MQLAWQGWTNKQPQQPITKKMRIKTLTLQNFKGTNSVTTLHPITCIAGSNGAGKSARLEAIRALMLGYDPRLGKRNQDVFHYSSGDECSVSGVIQRGANDIVASRTWRKVKGSVRAESNVPDAVTCSPVAFDPEIYFGLMERERVKFVFDVCRPSGDPFSALQTKLRQIPVSESGREYLKERIEEASGPGAKTAYEGLEQLDTSWRQMMSEAIFAAKKPIPEAGPAVDNIAALEKERKEADEKRSRLLTQMGQRASELEAAVVWNSERQWGIMALEQSAARTKQEQLVQKLSKLPQASPDKLAALKAEKTAVGTELLNNASDQEHVQDKLSAIQSEAETNLASECCPMCGESDGKWRRMYRAKVKGQQDELKEQLAGLTKKEALLKARVIEINAEIEREQAKLSDYIASKQEYQKQCQVLASMPDMSKAREYAARQERDIAGLNAVISEMEAERDQLSATLESVLDRIRSAESARAMHVARMVAIQEREQAKLHVTVLKGCLAAIQSGKAELVESTFGKLLATANALAGDILPGKLEYLDSEVGYKTKAGRWVSFKTLSGTEQSVAFAAIALALASETSKIVLIDELGRMTEANKLKLLAAADRMMDAGQLDQLVVCDVNPINYTHYGLKPDRYGIVML